MREVFGKMVWIFGKLLKGIALIGLYAIKASLGIFNITLLLFCMVAKLFLVFVKIGIPR